MVKIVHSDGSFDIDYDDGEEENMVAKDLVRMKGKNTKAVSATTSDELVRSEALSAEAGVAAQLASMPLAAAEADVSPRIEVGSKVEANYRGKGRFYPGRIALVNGDGTFDVDYDDGEKETRVAAALIRAKDVDHQSVSPRGDSAKIEVGDKVEGNFRGKGELSRLFLSLYISVS